MSIYPECVLFVCLFVFAPCCLCKWAGNWTTCSSPDDWQTWRTWRLNAAVCLISLRIVVLAAVTISQLKVVSGCSVTWHVRVCVCVLREVPLRFGCISAAGRRDLGQLQHAKLITCLSAPVRSLISPKAERDTGLRQHMRNSGLETHTHTHTWTLVRVLDCSSGELFFPWFYF